MSYPHVGPVPAGRVPLVEEGGIFLRYPKLHLSEFRRKPRKTPNGLVGKPVYQFRRQNRSATGGCSFKEISNKKFIFITNKNTNFSLSQWRYACLVCKYAYANTHEKRNY